MIHSTINELHIILAQSSNAPEVIAPLKIDVRTT